MTEPSPPEVRIVDESELRRLDSIGEFEERVQDGRLTTRVKPGSEHAAPERLGEVRGTVSHIVKFFDQDGELVAKVHE